MFLDWIWVKIIAEVIYNYKSRNVLNINLKTVESHNDANLTGLHGIENANFCKSLLVTFFSKTCKIWKNLQSIFKEKRTSLDQAHHSFPCSSLWQSRNSNPCFFLNLCDYWSLTKNYSWYDISISLFPSFTSFFKQMIRGFLSHTTEVLIMENMVFNISERKIFKSFKSFALWEKLHVTSKVRHYSSYFQI